MHGRRFPSLIVSHGGAAGIGKAKLSLLFQQIVMSGTMIHGIKIPLGLASRILTCERSTSSAPSYLADSGGGVYVPNSGSGVGANDPLKAKAPMKLCMRLDRRSDVTLWCPIALTTAAQNDKAAGKVVHVMPVP